MGEYANYLGESVKIGTCENMYYLRADQAHSVTAQHGNVDPVADRADLRFRFPFPDEDGIAPGAFADHARGVRVQGWVWPADWEGHSTIQLKSDVGYLMSIPCPESGATIHKADGSVLAVHRNGFQGACKLVQQRYWRDLLVGVIECACGAKFRLETIDLAEQVAVALRSEADRQQLETTRAINRGDCPEGTPSTDALYLHAVADRLLAGYKVSVS